MLAGLHGKALVAHADERADLSLYLFLRKFLARDSLVLEVIRTIYAAVHAVI